MDALASKITSAQLADDPTLLKAALSSWRLTQPAHLDTAAAMVKGACDQLEKLLERLLKETSFADASQRAALLRRVVTVLGSFLAFFSALPQQDDAIAKFCASLQAAMRYGHFVKLYAIFDQALYGHLEKVTRVRTLHLHATCMPT